MYRLSCSTFNQREGGIVRKLTKAAINFVKKEDGPTAVEYAIMLALIVTICIGVITTIGSNGNVMSSRQRLFQSGWKLVSFSRILTGRSMPTRSRSAK